MDVLKEYFEADSYRYFGEARKSNFSWLKSFFSGGDIILYLRLLRRAHFNQNKFLDYYYRFRLRYYRRKYGLELKPECNIGKGLYLGHPFNITINSAAVIGENCNIHKGVVIGQENRGRRAGAPIIGNKVWIGINSAIVGKITIGDDVLIAPCSYVNCDIPSHSIVYGNPCIIKHREDATELYINNCYEKNTVSY